MFRVLASAFGYNFSPGSSGKRIARTPSPLPKYGLDVVFPPSSLELFGALAPCSLSMPYVGTSMFDASMPVGVCNSLLLSSSKAFEI